MQSYQRDFIDFALRQGALRFGEFVLKSGRSSPYFFNSGSFNRGASLSELARYYATAIVHSDVEFDMLFGPAYKGIPLAAAVSMSLSDHFDRDVPYCFNRKEAKDHGEGGVTVGAELGGQVLIIDDVISAGTSTREAVSIIRAGGAEPVGSAISLDRQERGATERSAIQEVEHEFGLRVISIVGLADLVEYLTDRPELGAELEQVRAYREAYGVEPRRS